MSFRTALFSTLAFTLEERADLLAESHDTAVRLFNGFYEGVPDLVVDLYGRTLVLNNSAEKPHSLRASVETAQEFYLMRFSWLDAVLVKTRNAEDPAQRLGVITHGQALDTQVQENGTLYALDLRLNQDASFYIDTRELRSWLKRNMNGKRVLNTFAYTGSLGAAALAGRARQVVQTDRTERFLNLARQTYHLNNWPVNDADFIAADFFNAVSALKRADTLFGCVILDPPFFSTHRNAKIDLASAYPALVNKVRPLVAHGGCIVAVNNAVFFGGAEYLKVLEGLCADGYLQVETLLPVPMDACGYENTRVRTPPVDPAPFNHSTKIAILRVSRKDGRTE